MNKRKELENVAQVVKDYFNGLISFTEMINDIKKITKEKEFRRRW